MTDHAGDTGTNNKLDADRVSHRHQAGGGIDRAVNNDSDVRDSLPDIRDSLPDVRDSLPEVRDSLPADLDASHYVGPYMFPNNSRRRIPGVLYLVIGTGGIVTTLVASEDAVLVNNGFLVGGICLILLGLYHLQAGWNLAMDENDALVAAVRSVGFPVGHASAQLAWRGLRSRPTWRILLYSNEAPPAQRGLVLVDGVDGEIVESFTEENPEDWAGLTS